MQHSSWLFGEGGVALPLARGLAGSLDLQDPVRLQGVEKLHLRVSRYTLTLRRSLEKVGGKTFLPATNAFGISGQIQGRALYGPMPVKTETFREL